MNEFFANISGDILAHVNLVQAMPGNQRTYPGSSKKRNRGDGAVTGGVVGVIKPLGNLTDRLTMME